MELLQLVETIDLMAFPVAVDESHVKVSSEVELNLAVDACEVLLVFVEVDTLAAKVCKLGPVVHFIVEGELSVLELQLLGSTCLLGLGTSCLLALGGSSLLLLLNRLRHGFSLLSDRVRMDVPHEVP